MQNEVLKKYFLGMLDSDESKQLEIDILEDEFSEEIIYEAENDLIEDFLDSNLTNEEFIAFNRNFLITRDRQKRVEFTRLLRNYANRESNAEKQPNFFHKIKSLFFQPKFAFAAILIVFISFGLGYFVFNTLQNIKETEIAKLNKRDLTNLNDLKEFKSLNLTSDNLRSGVNSNLVNLNELSTDILLRLALPSNNELNRSFTVKIEKAQQNSQMLHNVVANNQEVRLIIPKSNLQTGEYRVILFNEKEKYTYYFAVQ